MACLYLVEEVSVVVKQLLWSRGLTPKVVIQGDILPVIKYFQFAGRLRRLHMHQPLESIRVTVSLHLPGSLFVYLPRVANGIADNLAGQASQFLLARYRSDPLLPSIGMLGWCPSNHHSQRAFFRSEAFTFKVLRSPGASRYLP